MADCDIIISIVTYQNSDDILKRCIHTILGENLRIKLYIIDNSPTDKIRLFCNSPKINYIFNNANVGYSRGHNIAIKQTVQQKVKYHLVLNPDVYFEKGSTEKLYDFMENIYEVDIYCSPCSMW